MVFDTPNETDAPLRNFRARGLPFAGERLRDGQLP
jgi:hypothetical protein